MIAHVKRVGGKIKCEARRCETCRVYNLFFVMALINSMIQEHEYYILFIT